MEKILRMVGEISGEELREVAVKGTRAAAKAGLFILDRYEKPHEISYKGEIDLVTETDLEAERIIKEALADSQGAEIIAEESSLASSPGDGTFWIVDPLDGTTNFAHGFPFFAPSIAYCQIKAGRFQPLFGCVFVPCLGEFFWAVRGGGSFLNTRSIRVSEEQEISRALLATGFPYDVHQEPEDVISALKEMLTTAQGIRRAGAAAIDLAYVACGRFEGFWEKKLKPWDTAAGQLLVEEAGGMLTDFQGKSYDPFVLEVIASNGLVHDNMVTILERFSG